MGMKNDKVGDRFWRDLQLVQLVQERVGDATHGPFNDCAGFSFDQIEVENFGSEKGNVLTQFERRKHKS
jgi:hypothetical protein